MAVTPPSEQLSLIGHQEAEKQVLSAAVGNKLHHAWLVTGQKGTGKATLAYRIARWLLSGAADEDAGNDLFGDPIIPESMAVEESHPVVPKVAHDTHPDLFVLEPDAGTASGDITVDQVRKVAEWASKTAAESKYRIILVDSADDMNNNAANALLKILEEPPVNTILLLVSHQPGKLLPTIRSRCRTLALAPLAKEDMDAVLEASGADIHSDASKFAISLSNGSPGVALEFIEHKAYDQYESLKQVLGDKQAILSVQKYAEKVAAKNDPASWWIFSMLWQHVLQTIIRLSSGMEVQHDTAEEASMFINLQSGKNTEDLCGVWDESNALIRDADHVHLDRKIVVLQLINMLKARP